MAPTPGKAITIRIFSDTICPWCFIGKRRLEKALAAVKASHGIQAQIEWSAFQLDATLPVEGMDKLTRYRQKFGRLDFLDTMKATGAKEGIHFSFGGLIANTTNSHRLIRLAASQNKQDAVVEALFKAYFENEQNIGDIETLVNIGTAAGVTGVRAMLQSDAFKDEVLDEFRTARADYSVTGVPFFVFNNSFSLSGAQEPAVIERVLLRIWRDMGGTVTPGVVAEGGAAAPAPPTAEAAAADKK